MADAAAAAVDLILARRRRERQLLRLRQGRRRRRRDDGWQCDHNRDDDDGGDGADGRPRFPRCLPRRRRRRRRRGRRRGRRQRDVRQWRRRSGQRRMRRRHMLFQARMVRRDGGALRWHHPAPHRDQRPDIRAPSRADARTGRRRPRRRPHPAADHVEPRHRPPDLLPIHDRRLGLAVLLGGGGLDDAHSRSHEILRTEARRRVRQGQDHVLAPHGVREGSSGRDSLRIDRERLPPRPHVLRGHRLRGTVRCAVDDAEHDADDGIPHVRGSDAEPDVRSDVVGTADEASGIRAFGRRDVPGVVLRIRLRRRVVELLGVDEVRGRQRLQRSVGGVGRVGGEGMPRRHQLHGVSRRAAEAVDGGAE